MIGDEDRWDDTAEGMDLIMAVVNDGIVDEEAGPEGARPEVDAPNPYPTNGRVETSNENYAAGGPPTKTDSKAVERALAQRRVS